MTQEHEVSLHTMSIGDWMELEDQVNCFTHITPKLKDKVVDVIRKHLNQKDPFMARKDEPADTICHTLMKVYVHTEDPELRERVLEALIMGRRMFDLLKEKNRKIVKLEES